MGGNREVERPLGTRNAARAGRGGTLDRIRNLWLLLRGQFWIVPVIISIAGLGLAYLLLAYGGMLMSSREPSLWWLYGGDADSAREVLSSVLSGLITMTSLVVSVTFVILTLAANQLGPRLIMIFIADRQIQTMLGLFLGTILYVLTVLRTLGDELGAGQVPHLAVTVGSGLTVVCLFALVFYLHKVARSIVADNVVGKVAADLSHQIRQVLPETDGSDPGPVPEDGEGWPIALERRGYVQAIDYSALVEIARKHDRVLTIGIRAGHFVLNHGEHITARPRRPFDEATLAAVRSAFIVGQERTPAQDIEFGIRQLVEIAVRALSPGINDVFTALAVADRLGAALEEILSRAPQPVLLRDDEGTVRVVADRSGFDGLLDAAFDQIRQAARPHPAVLIRMADVMAQLAPVLGDAARAGAVLDQLAKLEQTAGGESFASDDQRDVMVRIGNARAIIDRAFRMRSSAFAAV